jgi:serine/threonine-protein kinase RsbW
MQPLGYTSGNEKVTRGRMGGLTSRPCGHALRMSATSDRWFGPAEVATIGEMRHSVALYAASTGISELMLRDVNICVSEAVTNAVLHAYRDGRAGVVSVGAETSAHEFVLTVSDDGVGFGARPDSPGLGLGLPTMQAAANSMSIEPQPSGGTRVRMIFALGEPAVAQ